MIVPSRICKRNLEYKKWLTEEFGIDGWRLDAPNEIDDDTFWQELRRRCRVINPEAYLVGEIWGDASRWLQGDQFDAVVYYGDEIGLKGRHDPLNRQGMPWHKPESWNRALLEYTRRLISLRREHAALRRGSYRGLYARDGLHAFVRELQGERFLLVLNVNQCPAQLAISTAALPELRGEFHDLLGGFSAHADHQQFTGHDLPARSGTVFRQL